MTDKPTSRRPPFTLGVVPPAEGSVPGDHGPMPYLPPHPFVLGSVADFDNGLRSIMIKAFLVGCAAAISTGILIGLAIMWFVIR